MLDARPIEVRARLAPQVQDVLEALVGDERRARAAPLEQRVRRDRRAVREALDVRRRPAAAPRRRRTPAARSSSAPSPREPSVGDEHGVGEGAADVDPERAHRGIRTRTQG
jgi:hypothetical protein